MSEMEIGEARKRIEPFSNYYDQLKLFQDDVTFMEQGGQLTYALDFSLIRDYVLFSGSASIKRKWFQIYQFETLEDIKLGAQLAINYICEKLLLRSNEFEWNLIFTLLPSHAKELDGFLNWLKQEESKPLKELNRIQKNDKFLKVLDKAKNGDDLTAISNDDIDEALKEGLELISNYLNTQIHPIDKLNKLWSMAKFKEIELIGDEEFLSEITHDWEKDLVSEYSPASVFRDCRAVARTVSANHKNQKNRTVILTSNNYLHEELTRKQRRPYFADSYKDIFRHPRIFREIAAIDADHITKDEFKQSLNSKLHAMNYFLETSNNFLDRRDKDDFILSEDWQKQLDTIENKSKQREKDALKLQLSRIQLKENKASEHDSINLLRTLINKQKVREFILTRISNINSILYRKFDVAAYYLQLNYTTNVKLSISFYDDLLEGNKAVLKPANNELPYSLQFFNQDIIKILHKINDNPPIFRSIKPTLEAFATKDFSVEEDYELLLLMATIHAGMFSWSFAEALCERAIFVAEQEDIESFELTHEGYYLFSICLRKTSLTFSRLKRAIQFLEIAREKKKIRRSEKYEDPRYLKELGSIVLRIFSRFPHEATEFKGYDISKAFEYLAEAEMLAKDDLWLKIQILNNRLTFKIRMRNLKNLYSISDIADDYKLLKRILFLNNVNEIYWPAYLLSTLAEASYIANIDNDESVKWIETAVQKCPQQEKNEFVEIMKIRNQIITS